MRTVPLDRAEPPPFLDLPLPLSTFVGREQESTAVEELLARRASVRLISLTGPGGVGKTRLALEVTRSAAASFADGAVFVPLAPLRDPALVFPTIAKVVGLGDTAGRSIIEALSVFLRAKDLLLVLDNIEHVLSVTPLLAQLLGACPGLTLLVTSRSVLHISGEHTIRVPPLDPPSPDAPPRVDQLGQYDGIRLFVDRARAVEAGFELTKENATSVAAVCQRLDGLPLGIELAAARVSHLPPGALLTRLERRLPLLRGGPRDQPDRLRTMRDAIAWSHDLLSPDEQLLFRRLGVFAGGFTLEGAEAIANGGGEEEGRGGGEFASVSPSPSQGDSPVPLTAHSPSVLDLVASLVDSNLVQYIPGATGAGPRFGMLETIREFALEQLTKCGEDGATRDAHAAYFLAFAEVADDGLLLPDPVHGEWRERMASEGDNLRAALGWLDSREQEAHLLRLAVALGHFWFLVSDFHEGLGWLERVLERPQKIATPPPSQPTLRGHALFWAGLLALYQLDAERATAYLDESLGLFEQIGEKYGMARALVGAGLVRLHAGDYERALALHEQALALLQPFGDQEHGPSFFATVCFNNLGSAAYGRGDRARAVAEFDEALARTRRLGYTSLLLLPLAGVHFPVAPSPGWTRQCGTRRR